MSAEDPSIEVDEDLTRLRLKGVILCSFQRSEVTNLKLFRKLPYYPGDLEANEAFLFVSKMGDQVMFLFRDPLVDLGGRRRRVIVSQRLRLEGGSWSPYMLQDYAHKLGLHLIGIKRFEQVYEEKRKMKRARRQGRLG